MKLPFIKQFSDFQKRIDENQLFLNFKNPKTFEDLQKLGTCRWQPCREYNRNQFEEKINSGCYFIFLDYKNKPVFLLDNCDKSIVDFDNKEYKGVHFYEYLTQFPSIYNYIKGN